MSKWFILASSRMDEVVLEAMEATEGAVIVKAAELSRLCPHAIIIVRDYDEVNRWAYECGMDVELMTETRRKR